MTQPQRVILKIDRSLNPITGPITGVAIVDLVIIVGEIKNDNKLYYHSYYRFSPKFGWAKLQTDPEYAVFDKSRWGNATITELTEEQFFAELL
jgi:hypothetical protein